jgi:hypothetical protein
MICVLPVDWVGVVSEVPGVCEYVICSCVSGGGFEFYCLTFVDLGWFFDGDDRWFCVIYLDLDRFFGYSAR